MTRILKPKIFLTIFFAASILDGFGQQYVDLLKVNATLSPSNQFVDTSTSSDLHEYNVDLTIPVPLGEKAAILTGVIYDHAEMSLYSDTRVPRHYLDAISLKVGLNLKHSNKFSGTYVFLPKISSDFNNISPKDYQFGGVALWKYQKHDRLNYKFGMYFNGELFGPFAVAILGFYYQSEDRKFEANFTLPITADLNYRLSDRFKVGANFTSAVRSFQIDQQYTDFNEVYLQKSTNEIYPYIEFAPAKPILIQAFAGYSIGRGYKVFEQGDRVDFRFIAFNFGDQRTQLNTRFSDGFVARFRLIYRLDLSKNNNEELSLD